MTAYSNPLSELPTAKKKRKWLKRLVYILLLLIIIVGIARLYAKPTPEIWCETGIKSALKSPTSFKPILSFRLNNAIHTTFASQNGFGAMVEGNAVCEFSTIHDLKKMDLKSIKLNGNNFTKLQLLTAEVAILTKRIRPNFQSLTARLFGI